MKLFIRYIICLLPLFASAQNAKIDSLTVRLAYQNKDSTKVETSLALINELFKAEDYKKALLFTTQTIELSKNINHSRGLAETSLIKALIYYKQNEYTNAIASFEMSKMAFQSMSDTLGIAKVNNNLGIIEIKRGNYAKGLQNSLAAISIFEEKGLSEELNNAYNSLANAYFNTGKIEKALEFNKKALLLSEELNNLEGIKLALKNIGELYAIQKDYNSSIENYERLLSLLNPETDKNLRTEILPSIAKSYLAIDELKKVSEYMNESLRHSRRQKNNVGILQSLNVAGALNIKNQRLRLAENQLYEAYLLAKKIDNKPELLYNLRLNITLDSTRQFYEDAFNWQNQYYSLKKEIDKEKEEKAQALLIQNTFTNSAINEIAPKKTIIAETVTLDSKPKKIDMLLVYSLIAALVFISILLIVSYLKRTKESKLLEKHANQNKELALINNQLEEVNQVKDKLFSIVSHDLKDSISSIKAFLDLLKDKGITVEEFNQLIPELSENANNASLLLFNLLNWSKSQMQNLEPKPELFNIQEVFQIKISLIEKKVQDKGIILIDESKRDFVYADRSMLEIVIQNLITNAVKFTGKGDVITVSNQDYNGKVLICIEDTGIGISKENIEKLFNAKKNFTTIGTENEKGTGLGLTICKDLVELNNGRIWVESTPNIGSKFFIELPKAEISN